MVSRESVRRVVRTFVVSFLGLFIPGLLGFLHAVTDWAATKGQEPFPDASNLTYVAVSALSAASIALVQLIWNATEDAAGKGFLRDVPPTPARRRAEGGRVVLGSGLLVLLLIVVLLIILL